MENEIIDNLSIDNISNDNSLDIIIEKLQQLNLYLKTDNSCKMLLKLSEQELQNEIKFKSRAKKIQKYHQKHDQTILKENMINELQQIIDSNNLNIEVSQENNAILNLELEPKIIAEICDKIMILKMSDIKNIKSFEASIKSNKLTLKEFTKIEKEINVALDKLSPKDISPKKSETKVTQQMNNSKHHKSSVSLSNVSRRNERDTNCRVYSRTHVEHVRRFGSTTNEDCIIIEPQTHRNETIRMRLETDRTRITENFINRSNIDQNTR
ncbi:Hypothetical protein CINCED_3A006515 [Cinara cedri]|uniref:Uncharacterized protein n=1 Tax=Cinara cedri TaxID=506608 RepID=A0A5E4MUE5_9HEMI|nr:Hypothetical protein CINCED_3A006515 [Cinara cedri]